MFNDQGEFRVPLLTSAGAQLAQLAMYNGFEPYQFPNWAGPNDVEPGMIKYWPSEWQPCAVMRGTRVGVAGHREGMVSTGPTYGAQKLDPRLEVASCSAS